MPRKKSGTRTGMDKLERAEAKGEIVRIRTIKPSPDTYIHIGIGKRRGKRGGTTVAGRVRRIKKR
ncbi:MAG: hypothetical protein KGH50_00075 [Candidatus Micrarchaeota archaeon]|nr:hypothetical protein [Candidatus Micrarchaeota archaeon]